MKERRRFVATRKTSLQAFKFRRASSSRRAKSKNNNTFETETIMVSDQATDADESRLSKYKLNFVILFQIYSPCAILTAGILILMVTFVDFRGASHDLCLRSTGFLRTSRTEGSSAIEMLVLRSSWPIFYAIPTNLRHTSYFQICLVFFFFFFTVSCWRKGGGEDYAGRKTVPSSRIKVNSSTPSVLLPLTSAPRCCFVETSPSDVSPVSTLNNFSLPSSVPRVFRSWSIDPRDKPPFWITLSFFPLFLSVKFILDYLEYILVEDFLFYLPSDRLVHLAATTTELTVGRDALLRQLMFVLIVFLGWRSARRVREKRHTSRRTYMRSHRRGTNRARTKVFNRDRHFGENRSKNLETFCRAQVLRRHRRDSLSIPVSRIFPRKLAPSQEFYLVEVISLVNRVTATVSRPAVARRALSNSHTLSLIIPTIPSFFCCHSPLFSSSPFLSPKYYKSIGTIRSKTDMKQTKQVRLKINVTVAPSTDVTRFTHIGPPPSRSLLSYSYNGL